MTCWQCSTSFYRKRAGGGIYAKRDSGRFCSRSCAGQWRTARAAERKPPPAPPRVQPPRTAVCVQCRQSFIRRDNRQQLTCGRACTHARQRGRKLTRRTFPRQCATCSQRFTAKQARVQTCPTCRKKRQRKLYGGHKHTDRARRFGVARRYNIDPLKVFARDRWHCQLCGRATPQRLRGSTKPTAPELDHIVPLSAGGGHTWDNVQCACRSCNGKKSARPLGQLRLAI
jgi:5-methylcytosine-specific restriction endonuclease McrA